MDDRKHDDFQSGNDSGDGDRNRYLNRDSEESRVDQDDTRNKGSSDHGEREDSWRPPVYGQGSYDHDPREQKAERDRERRVRERMREDRMRQTEDERRGIQGRQSSGMNSEPTRADSPERLGYKGPEQYRAQPTKTNPLVVLVSILLTFVLTSGIFISFIWNNIERFPVGEVPQTTSRPDSDEDDDGSLASKITNNSKLQEIVEILQDNYYRELTDQEIIDAIVNGLPDTIESPYTYYMSADQYQAMQESIQGEYSGIGATVQMVTEGVYEIVEPTEGSPAQSVGLKPGDRFVAVNGTAVGDFPTVTDLATAVKGETGTVVELEMYRPSTGENLTFEIERRPIVSHPVSYRMQEDDLGYMQIREFSLNLPEEFQNAMRDMISQGAESIVFDLRNNPGGAADAAIKVLDYLLPEGVIATVRGRQGGEETEYNWTSDEAMFVPEDMNYIILVNRNSASASELFTGTLRDYDKTHIIGEQTYGKGSGTVAYQLDDGSAVNVTIFNYYLPGGELIEGVGIDPDEEVSLSPESSTKLISELTLEEDLQLQSAIEYWHGTKNE